MATTHDTVACPECSGTGWCASIEVPGWEEACYHCSNTGRISRESLFRDQLHNVCQELAAVEIGHCDDHTEPGVDDIGLCAAEAHCSVSDYKRVLLMDATNRMMRAIRILMDVPDKPDWRLHSDAQAFLRNLVERLDVGPDAREH